MDTPKRYHPLLVTLHWLVALLVFTDLYIGYFYIRPIMMRGRGGVPSTDLILKIHMAAGLLILALIVIRFIVRLSNSQTCARQRGSQNPELDRQARSLRLVFLRVCNDDCRITTFFADQSLTGGFSRGHERTG